MRPVLNGTTSLGGKGALEGVGGGAVLVVVVLVVVVVVIVLVTHLKQKAGTTKKYTRSAQVSCVSLEFAAAMA